MIAENELTQAQLNAPDAQEFHITHAGSANWLLRQLANNQAEIDRVKAQAQEIIKSLEADNARLQGLYLSELEVWARQELEAQGGRKKTLKLLQGSCGFRTVPQSLRVVDEMAARAYIESVHEPEVAADYLETTVRLKTATYREWAQEQMQESGELLPGLDIVPARESFSIRFGKEKD